MSNKAAYLFYNGVGCVFCERVRNEEYERTFRDDVVRFEPLGPVVRGHMLFIPKRHVGNAAANPGLTELVFGAAALYARERGGEFNLITSAGPCASQTVYHLHVHYVPRVLGDGLLLPWTDQRRPGPVGGVQPDQQRRDASDG